jgi:Tfp pilus assembly protein PilV
MLIARDKHQASDASCSRPRSTRDRRRSDAGFTIIEVLIASVVLIVGLATLMGLLDTSVKATASTRAREGATNLAREVLEDARTLAYSQISPTSIVGQLQSMNGLQNQSGGGTWQIVRRGVTYTVNVNECAVDDPKDGLGVHVNPVTKENPFCKDAGEGEWKAGEKEDATPEDLKRITAEVTWTAIGRKPAVKEVETLASAGETPGLSASGLKMIEPPVGAPTAPVIVSQPAENKLVFSVQSPSGTTGLQWSLNGVRQTNEPTFVKGSGTEWRFSWFIPLGEVSDGTYLVSVQAVDAAGIYGPPISISVTLIRTVPAAPKITYAGFNEVYVSGVRTRAVELQWQANVERNVLGYRVYDPAGDLVCPGSKEILSTQPSCIDLLAFAKSPTFPSKPTYSVVALYRGATGETLSNKVSEGPASNYTLSETPLVPEELPTPPGLEAKKTEEGAVVLKWTKPLGGPPIAFYRVYRGTTAAGAQNYTSRYATVSPATTEFTDTHSETEHYYWVTAVSETMTESPLLGWVKQ